MIRHAAHYGPAAQGLCLAQRILQQPEPGLDDQQAVARSLRRSPRGGWRVVARNVQGEPSVIARVHLAVTMRVDTTLYWVVDPQLRASVADLERQAGVAHAEAWLRAAPSRGRQLEQAHRRYAWTRWRLLAPSLQSANPTFARAMAPGRTGVGGIERWRCDPGRPVAVKCLHAHLAQHLAEAALASGAAITPPNPVARGTLARLDRR
ncbi:MAG: DUF501 domain-containing protein [Planctomycetota bacterium]